MIDNEIVEGVMESAEDDYIDMTDIMHYIRDQADGSPARLRIAATVADKLVREGRIVPGDLTREGFYPWLTSPDESADRITSESNLWADERKEVHFGTIAWFDLPSRIAARAADRDAATPSE
ncbi:hypothetical protein [Actinoalloteichus fjordicus]|uniref:Uncharacterized protein n=1 Tax=Actinoalloteichus fjordicus TaxID=1612552 RepID=A0AAC9LHM9_9PSEU|nr:hypothetical protein [Actinoalloteichus fjordicus]APU17085.1 hypothetical protein UA74_25380 [Actinoalloteichus fjordicus]